MMATCKIFHRQGASGTSDLLDYILNEEKTIVEVDLANEVVNNQLNYIMQEGKTLKQYVTAINCDIETANEEFLSVKKQFDKMDKIQVWHAIQSFPPGEITADEAHRLGIEMANRMWGDKYQVVVTTHLDRKHLHNHFAINSVSFVDGKKYHRSKKEYLRMQKTNDAICIENGYSIIKEIENKGKSYYVWDNERKYKTGITKRDLLKEDIDEAISNSVSMPAFISIMKSYGYEIKTDRKYMAFRYMYDDNGEYSTTNRFIRLKSLGEGYSENDIIDRIFDMDEPSVNLEKSNKQIVNMKYRGNFYNRKKRSSSVGDLIMLYIFHIPIVYSNKSKYQRVHYATRKDVLKLQQYQEAQLFIRKMKIESFEELKNYKLIKQNEILMLDNKKTELVNENRQAEDFEIVYNNQIRINELSSEISSARKEVLMCERCIDKIEIANQRLELINDAKKEEKENEYRKSSDSRDGGASSANWQDKR